MFHMERRSRNTLIIIIFIIMYTGSHHKGGDLSFALVKKHGS